jgi:asparagine synthase (glutamine-hydrolysing)
MCGIAGWLFSPGTEPGFEALGRVSAAIEHRGPDDAGEYRDASSGVALAHRRLSIIDLSEASHQPMLDKEHRVALAYNGELYNFRELRRELQGRGHAFRSAGDTEVVLRSYVEWGSGAFERFKGMFAVALWDAKSGVLHLVRDPMGIKPLYYWRPTRGGVVFASEVKAFLALPEFQSEVNRTALRQFLEFGYTFDETGTILDGVCKLAPGHRIEVRGGQMSAQIRYYTPDLRPYPVEKSDDIEDRLYGTLSEVVKQHLVADVPVGMLLSGGLDSSLVASLAARQGDLHTFSFGFAGSQVDERSHARRVADFIGSRHEETLIQPAEIVEGLEENARYFDDLFADWGMITTRLLYKKCRERGIKVVIVGEGSDELFGGYDIFRHSLPEWSKGPLEWRLFQLYRAYAGRRYGTQYPAYRRRMKDYLRLTDGDMFAAIRLFETRNQLPNNYVMKVDKASMSVSVEARVPYLTPESQSSLSCSAIC